MATNIEPKNEYNEKIAGVKGFSCGCYMPCNVNVDAFRT